MARVAGGEGDWYEPLVGKILVSIGGWIFRNMRGDPARRDVWHEPEGDQLNVDQTLQSQRV